MSKIKCGSRSAGKTEKDFDPYWLDIGEKVEYEHTCDKTKARRIAMDHLAEFPEYYKELQKMEAKLESKSERKSEKKPTTKHKNNGVKIEYTKNIVNKMTDDVERNMDDIVKATDKSKKKVINNLKNNFVYKEV